MIRQRTLFYKPIPPITEDRRKDNRPPRPMDERRRRPVKAGAIDVHFSNRTVTSFGGYVALKPFTDQLRLRQRFARSIRIKKEQGFTIPELGCWFVDTKLLGVERLTHIDALCRDPLLSAMNGLDTMPAGVTEERYLRRFKAPHNAAFEGLNTGVLTWLSRRALTARQRRVIFDYDTTTMAVYGKQEGANRGRSFRKKDKPGFQPKFAFIGGLDVMVHQRLYPLSQGLASDFRTFHAETRARLPEGMWPWAVRGDTAIFSDKNIRLFEREKLVYGISAPMNAPLRRRVETIPEDAWLEGLDERDRRYSVARIRYRPKTWSGPERTFIISRRLKDRPTRDLFGVERYDYFAYITNYRVPLVDQYRFSVERCSLERCVKESKLGFALDHLPCGEFDANQAYLHHVQLAYNIAIAWKLIHLPRTRGVNRWTVATIRRWLWCVPGTFRRRGDRWSLSLAAYWPSDKADVLRHALGRLLRSPPDTG
jgi:hypothetical protein